MTTTTATATAAADMIAEGGPVALDIEAGEIVERYNSKMDRTEYRAYPLGADNPEGGSGAWYATRVQAETILVAALAVVTEQATAITEAAAPVKAKKVTCPGSSTYVAHNEEDISEVSKKGRAAYAIVACPSCDTVIEAGVWFTDKGADLRDTRGLTYLPKHTA
jgi:hypothetical protein